MRVWLTKNPSQRNNVVMARRRATCLPNAVFSAQVEKLNIFEWILMFAWKMFRAIVWSEAVRWNQTRIAVATVALCSFIRIKNNAQRLIALFCNAVNQIVVSAYLRIILRLLADVFGLHTTIMADADEQHRNYKSDMSSNLSHFSECKNKKNTE